MRTGPRSCQASGLSLRSPATQYGQRWGRWGSCVAHKWGEHWPARSAVHGTLSPVGKTEGSAQGIRSWGWRGVGRREGALQRGRWRGCCSREGARHSPSPTTSQRPPAARCCPDAQGGAGAWTGARLHGAAWRALLQPSCSQRGLFKLPRVLGSWSMAPMTFRGGGHLLREAFSASCPPIRAVPGLRALGAGTGTAWGTQTRPPGHPALRDISAVPAVTSSNRPVTLPLPSTAIGTRTPHSLQTRRFLCQWQLLMEPSPGTWARSRHIYVTNRGTASSPSPDACPGPSGSPRPLSPPESFTLLPLAEKACLFLDNRAQTSASLQPQEGA